LCYGCHHHTLDQTEQPAQTVQRRKQDSNLHHCLHINPCHQPFGHQVCHICHFSGADQIQYGTSDRKHHSKNYRRKVSAAIGKQFFQGAAEILCFFSATHFSVSRTKTTSGTIAL
jgi:hypothetical protein